MHINSCSSIVKVFKCPNLFFTPTTTNTMTTQPMMMLIISIITIRGNIMGITVTLIVYLSCKRFIQHEGWL